MSHRGSKAASESRAKSAAARDRRAKKSPASKRPKAAPAGMVNVDGVLVPSGFELARVGDLHESPDNPRLHPPEQVSALASFIREVGFLQPLLVDARGTILAGAGRRLAAIELAVSRVPIVRADHLTPAQRRAFLVADNKLGLMSSWSAPALSKILSAIAQDYGSPALVGFSDEEMRRLSDDLARVDLGDGPRPRDEDEDDDPEPAPSPSRSSGDDEEELVPFQVLVPPKDREELYAALRTLKSRDGVKNSGVALLTIVREWKP